MNAHDVERSSTTAGLPISPGLGPALEQAHIIRHPNVLDSRTLFIVGLSVVLALATTIVARGLIYSDRVDHQSGLLRAVVGGTFVSRG